MAFILDRRIPTNSVQVLGQLPADSLGNVVLSLESNYDGANYRVLSTGTNSGRWIRLAVPQANVPMFSGLYVGSVSTTVEMPLTLNTTFQSLNQLAVTLSNFVGAGVADQLLDGLLVQVVGLDDPTLTENTVVQNTTEYNLQVAPETAHEISITTTEYNIDEMEDTTYEGLDNSRLTYHN